MPPPPVTRRREREEEAMDVEEGLKSEKHR